MKTLYPVLTVFAIGVVGIMWAMSGMGAMFADDPAQGIESDQSVNETAGELEDTDDSSGFFDTSNQGDDSFVGAIITGGQQIASLVTAAVLLPFELQRLGIPRWLAVPLGLAGQAVAFIGFVQFITGRKYE